MAVVAPSAHEIGLAGVPPEGTIAVVDDRIRWGSEFYHKYTPRYLHY